MNSKKWTAYVWNLKPWNFFYMFVTLCCVICTYYVLQRNEMKTSAILCCKETGWSSALCCKETEGSGNNTLNTLSSRCIAEVKRSRVVGSWMGDHLVNRGLVAFTGPGKGYCGHQILWHTTYPCSYVPIPGTNWWLVIHLSEGLWFVAFFYHCK